MKMTKNSRLTIEKEIVFGVRIFDISTQVGDRTGGMKDIDCRIGIEF